MECPSRQKRALLVDPDPTAWRDVQRACGHLAKIEVCGDFTAARRSLVQNAPDLLVTNLRLGAYNGLHLVYLASTNGIGTRTVVYARTVDMSLIREAQSLGAFFESHYRLAHAIASYLTVDLPERDRREPREFDRRAIFRGGRRSSDVIAAAS
jgi:ActR/RegA family two-component response regulator